jgi:CRP-like cAMP-binding protein
MKTLLDVCTSETLRIYPAGTMLMPEGGNTGHIYVLAEGSMQVLRGETPVATISEPGAVFGEMSVLLGIPHTATVRTLTDSALHEFTDAESFLRSDPEVTLAVARLLAQRLNLATGYLADLKKQYAGEGNHLGMVSEVLASLINQPRRAFNPGSDRDPDYP